MTTYLAEELITRSLYLTGIVGRQTQTPTTEQINDGLFLLNELLDVKFMEPQLIPYWTYNTDYTAVAGQEEYFITNCCEIESVTFNIDTVRYPMDFTNRKSYFGSVRIDDVSSLPFNWYFNRSKGGGTLYLYFLPASAYPLKIMGKFALTDVTLSTDLTTLYDGAYLSYMRYELGRYICDDFNLTFPEQHMQELMRKRKTLINVSPPDLTVRKKSVLTKGAPINFGDINIGRGYRPN